MQKQYRWVPAPLINDLAVIGDRWELQSLSDSPGYWKYEGRVCYHRYDSGYGVGYVTEVGTFDTMATAAKALLANRTAGSIPA